MVTSQVSITIPNYCFSHNISYLPRQFVTPSLAAPLPVIVQIFYILFQPPNPAGLYPSSLPVFSCRLIVLFVPTNRTLVISCGWDQLILLYKYNNNIDNLPANWADQSHLCTELIHFSGTIFLLFLDKY